MVDLEAIKDSVMYTAAETARLLGVSYETVRRHSNDGTLKCHIRRGNGRRAYLGRDIRRFVMARY